TFPQKLLDEWHLYAQREESENSDPSLYNSNQLFMVLQLSNGGTDLESYQFASAVQAEKVFVQLCLSLAAAEQEMEFEHRDLHWGNVLIAPTEEERLSYIVDEK